MENNELFERMVQAMERQVEILSTPSITPQQHVDAQMFTYVRSTGSLADGVSGRAESMYRYVASPELKEELTLAYTEMEMAWLRSDHREFCRQAVLQLEALVNYAFAPARWIQIAPRITAALKWATLEKTFRFKWEAEADAPVFSVNGGKDFRDFKSSFLSKMNLFYTLWLAPGDYDIHRIEKILVTEKLTTFYGPQHSVKYLLNNGRTVECWHKEDVNIAQPGDWRVVRLKWPEKNGDGFRANFREVRVDEKFDDRIELLRPLKWTMPVNGSFPLSVIEALWTVRTVKSHGYVNLDSHQKQIYQMLNDSEVLWSRLEHRVFGILEQIAGSLDLNDIFSGTEQDEDAIAKARGAFAEMYKSYPLDEKKSTEDAPRMGLKIKGKIDLDKLG